jgi:hypothetical protein
VISYHTCIQDGSVLLRQDVGRVIPHLYGGLKNQNKI